MYPFASLNCLPCIDATYFDYLDVTIPLTVDILALFYCNINTPYNIYIGLLPIKDRNIWLIFPEGCLSLSAWYFSEQLKLAFFLLIY